jgi:hypothetical protein
MFAPLAPPANNLAGDTGAAAMEWPSGTSFDKVALGLG